MTAAPGARRQAQTWYILAHGADLLPALQPTGMFLFKRTVDGAALMQVLQPGRTLLSALRCKNLSVDCAFQLTFTVGSAHAKCACAHAIL